MILGQTEALQEIVKVWTEDATRLRRYDPDDPRARVLSTCAEDVHRILGSHGPEWVPISMVQEWTGWSRQTIRKRCREVLGPRQEARKGSAGEWEVQLAVALSWAQKTAADVDLEEVTDIRELARLVGREG